MRNYCAYSSTTANLAQGTCLSACMYSGSGERRLDWEDGPWEGKANAEIGIRAGEGARRWVRARCQPGGKRLHPDISNVDRKRAGVDQSDHAGHARRTGLGLASEPDKVDSCLQLAGAFPGLGNQRRGSVGLGPGHRSVEKGARRDERERAVMKILK
ncbi:hypothetical protein BD310DRAFT_938096 [Dichomitus squalens]|uniref:Uncharacterized protein n=1 Tax=Dichomitus squalens TaxID=114155 RepID=A0A4Q9PHN6_9APHY|nr:hypothetical protein BD310DRAFT_938096 [Dichomitus squalens]